MSKKFIFLGLAVLLLLAALGVPQTDADVSAVVHQHLTFPKEVPGDTGFQPDGNLRSHLPLVVIRSDGNTIPGLERTDPEKLRCSYSVFDRRSGVNSTGDQPTITGTLELSIRGNSSREFPKKQYSVKLVDESGAAQKQPLLGMPAQSSWVLNGSMIDRSMVRDYMLYNLSGEIMKEYVPRCRLCEVLFTDSSGALTYQGVYTLIEKISVCQERLNLEPYDPDFSETSFLLQMNNHLDHYRIPHLKPDEFPAYAFDLEYPAVDELSAESLSYIRQELLVFEKAMHDAYITQKWDKISRMADLDSFVDYFLINEFFQNYDAGYRSTFLYQDLDGVFCIGPVWDFDGSFNNYQGTDLSIAQIQMTDTLYYSYLIQDPAFVRRCIDRYRQLRQTVLSEEYLIGYLEDASAYLAGAGVRNCEKWYAGDTLTTMEDIEKMKDFIRIRGQWLDRHLDEVSAVMD